MKMKIFSASFQCESNTFCKSKAGYDDFEILRGQDVIDKMAASSVFLEAGAEIVPGVFASALPSGRVKREAFDVISDEIVSRFRENSDIDGIYLYLHGSMFIEDLGSGEEALVKRLRKAAGSDIPIAVALDFHANNTPDFIKQVNIVHGFRTAPHTDHDQTEKRAARGLLRCINENVLPKPAMVKVPVLAADAAVTVVSPLKEIVKRLFELDEADDIYSAAFFNGQPWADFEYVGPSVVIMYDQNKEAAVKAAFEMADMFWDGKEKLTLGREAMLPGDAIVYAKSTKQTPVFITDSGDNTTAGAEGEGTYLLSEIMKSDMKNVLVCAVTDKEAATSLFHKEIGQSVAITLGADQNGTNIVPVSFKGNIKRFGNVIGWSGEIAGGGVTVSLDGLDVVVTDVRAAFLSERHFESMGINPYDYNVIVLKMGYLFPELERISTNHVFALTPGASTNLFDGLAYKNINRPMYPIDKDFDWRPKLL